MGSKMSNPLTSVLNLLFGASFETGKKRQLEQQQQQRSQQRQTPNDGGGDEDNKNDCWIQDYDDKRRRIYYYNPQLQEISWDFPSQQQQQQHVRIRRSQPHVGSLPPNSEWAVAYDRTNELPYYYHPKTQESCWELPEPRRCKVSNTIIIQYKESPTGIIPVSSSTSSFASIRDKIMEQLDADMRPAMGQEWSFQLQQPNVIVSRRQESRIDFLQTFLRQQNPLRVKIIERGGEVTTTSNDGMNSNHGNEQEQVDGNDNAPNPPSEGSQQDNNPNRRSTSSTPITDNNSSKNISPALNTRPPLMVPRLPPTTRGQNSTASATPSTRSTTPSSRRTPSTSTTTRSPPPPPPPPPPALTKRTTRRTSERHAASSMNSNGSNQEMDVHGWTVL
jgi:hypothetical protein